MEKHEVDKVLRQFAIGNTSRADEQGFNAWLQNATESEYEAIVASYYAMLKDTPVFDAVDAALLNKIEQRLDVYEQNQRKRSFKLKWNLGRVAAAASIVIALSAGLYFYTFRRYFANRQSQTVNQNDIAPGRSTATLKLANGKTITLSDAKTGVVVDAAKLTYNDGSLVQNSSGSHFSGSQKGDQKNTGPVGVASLGANEKMTLSTPRGGTYQITLSDGTKVWLNAASSLTYTPALNENGIRRVKLAGEGYFEVAKDKAHPFRVTTSRQTIEVLGTHFNVNSYSDDRTNRTSLLEGSVAVSFSGQRYRLKPGQQAIVGLNAIQVNNFDVEEAIAWKNGMFMFSGQELESIMNQVSRWYDVTVEYNDDSIKKQTFDGSVSRFQNISQLLEVLESTGSVHFKLAGRRLTVMK
jgi:transmembrane sensor